MQDIKNSTYLKKMVWAQMPMHGTTYIWWSEHNSQVWVISGHTWGSAYWTHFIRLKLKHSTYWDAVLIHT